MPDEAPLQSSVSPPPAGTLAAAAIAAQVNSTSTTGKPAWERLRNVTESLETATKPHRRIENPKEVYAHTLSPVDRFALRVTNKIGSFGFFLIIVVWTILWIGYNLLAGEVRSLHWKAFDSFPAFFIYFLVSNVIQLLLMPLILIGQNLQSRFADTRAELDFTASRAAEKEATITLNHVEHQGHLLLLLLRHIDVQVPEGELEALEATARPRKSKAFSAKPDPV